jgi:hypothetical protein
MPVSIPETPREDALSATAAYEAQHAAPEPDLLAQGSVGMRLLLFTFLALSVAILVELMQGLFSK